MSDAASDYSRGGDGPSGNHFKVVCRCGKMISQCRCPAPDKEVRISSKPCDECKDKIPGYDIPDPPPIPSVTAKGLTKENFKHVDSAVALYNFSCQQVRELESEAKESEALADSLKQQVMKASKEMEQLQERLRTAYREKERLGKALLKAAGV